MSLTEAAPVVGMHYDYAREIVVAYNRNGAEGLRNRRKNPRPYQDRRLLNDAQESALAQRLTTPPADGGVWTGPKVAREIATMTGRETVWPQRGWDYLRRLGYSIQEPRPQHRQSDPEARAAFKKTARTRNRTGEGSSPE
jgi:transposase